tara:strand:+ start:7755 stop:8567 length:813 start_codon:yes stop_codon:yes gene_type:complete
MKTKQTLLVIIFFLNSQHLFSKLPNNVSQKYLLVYSINEQQEKKIKEIHKTLTSLGIDVVNYINRINISTSKETQNNLFVYLNEREINNVLVYLEEAKTLGFYEPNYILDQESEAVSFFAGDSLFYNLRESLLEKNKPQETFIYSPTPEIINKIKTKPFTKILFKPKLEDQKIGTTKEFLNLESDKVVLVEPKEDYRFYYANGINYIINFYRGTEEFMFNSFGVDGLSSTSNKEKLILVLENTASRNKFFYFTEGDETQEQLLLSFLSEQ